MGSSSSGSLTSTAGESRPPSVVYQEARHQSDLAATKEPEQPNRPDLAASWQVSSAPKVVNGATCLHLEAAVLAETVEVLESEGAPGADDSGWALGTDFDPGMGPGSDSDKCPGFVGDWGRKPDFGSGSCLGSGLRRHFAGGTLAACIGFDSSVEGSGSHVGAVPGNPAVEPAEPGLRSPLHL